MVNVEAKQIDGGASTTGAGPSVRYCTAPLTIRVRGCLLSIRQREKKIPYMRPSTINHSETAAQPGEPPSDSCSEFITGRPRVLGTTAASVFTQRRNVL
jgi:hypothetical protein